MTQGALSTSTTIEPESAEASHLDLDPDVVPEPTLNESEASSTAPNHFESELIVVIGEKSIYRFAIGRV